LSRARELPPGVLLKKVLMKLVAIVACKLEEAKTKLSRSQISTEKLLKSLDGLADLQQFLANMRKKRPKFFIEPLEKEAFISVIQGKLPELKDHIIAEADKDCSHILDLLGSGDVNLDEFVETNGGRDQCGYLPWHFDFKTGYRWNANSFYKEIKIPYGKADIKVPWELSRFQHVTVLGQAYWLTNDEKYAEEFVKEVEDWIDHNPPKFGVNWTCTMDVAIRVANWIWGYYFFKDSREMTDGFLIKFLKSLLAHGRHIMANLENRAVTTNHYLSDIIGLIYLGICFPEFKEAKHWREFGVQELEREMDKQVYDDGMDFEASTCYHRLALELFFYPALLCQLNDIKLPQKFFDKLRKMFDFVLYVLKPNGRMPQIGDNDNGRLHVLGKRDILDMTYLLTFATLFFDDPKYKIEEFGFAQEAIWLFGPDAYKRWQDMPGRSVQALESKAFPDGGIYVMRHKNDYMLISCGPNGQNGKGGHAHNDKLSFELCVDGEDIIVDPGTYVYTADPEWRNRFRSTACHNIVMIDNEEQTQLNKGELFSLRSCTVSSVHNFLRRPHQDFFEAEHTGYQSLRSPVRQRRRISYGKDVGFWEFADSMEGEGQWPITVSFHLATGLFPRIIAPNCFVVTTKRKCLVKFSMHLANEAAASIETTESWFSPAYGSKYKSTAVRYRFLHNLPVELLVEISYEDGHLAKEAGLEIAK
jgi:hypothetical protein